MVEFISGPFSLSVSLVLVYFPRAVQDGHTYNGKSWFRPGPRNCYFCADQWRDNSCLQYFGDFFPSFTDFFILFVVFSMFVVGNHTPRVWRFLSAVISLVAQTISFYSES